MQKFKNILAFVILMSGKKALDKSPEYIMEKFNRYCLSDKDETEFGLDSDNMRLMDKYLKKWITGNE